MEVAAANALVTLVPGLKKRTGYWAVCIGLFRPKVCVDPCVDREKGANSLVIHEWLHAREKHALLCIIVGIITLGTCYMAMRRACEVKADAFALQTFGMDDFKAFVHMHPHPKTKTGRYLYGKTPEERIARTEDYCERHG